MLFSAVGNVENGRSADGKQIFTARWKSRRHSHIPQTSFPTAPQTWPFTHIREEGYIITNILSTGKMFRVGEENTKAFVDYAYAIALSHVSNSNAYWYQSYGQDFYYFLKDIQQKLSEDVDFGAELAQRMETIGNKLLQKGRTVFLAAGPEENLEQIRQITDQYISKLPTKELRENQVEPNLSSQDVAIAVESSNQHSYRVANCYLQEGFLGRYIPFLIAAEDLYILPKLRFQMNAYSAGQIVDLYDGYIALYATGDPNAAATLEVFDGIEEFIANMELTQEDLDGYILTSFSSFGQSVGVLQEPMQAMEREILGYDAQVIEDMINDIKSATLAGQQAAAMAIGALFDHGSTVTLGNEAVLTQDQDAYDQFISFRSSSQSVDSGEETDSSADNITTQNWYDDAMRYVWEKEWMDDQADPTAPINRAALLTALWRLAGQPEVDFAIKFTDVSEDAAYAEAVRWASSEQILDQSADTFNPEDPITREEIAVLLYRYAQSQDYDVSVGKDANLLSYTDAAEVGEDALAAMLWACEVDIIRGAGDGTLLNPLEDGSYAEAAVMLMQLSQLLTA